MILRLSGLLLCLFLLTSNSEAQSKVQKRITKLFPGCTVKVLDAKDHFTERFEIFIPQLLDHSNPKAGQFMQKILIYHVDREAPVHFETEGYWANGHIREGAQMLQGNQILVEYRFYGKSVPEGTPWEYLTNEQAIEDLHRINITLKQFYKGPWLASGVSKGGETTILYKYKYPDDCVVYMPYVAPIILAREDPRTEVHIKTVGSDSCRKALYEFQRRSLEQRDSMLIYLKNWSEEKSLTYELAGFESALEYAVLEFTFSFWQWGGASSEIPGPGHNVKDHFNYIDQIVGFDFYSDDTFHCFLLHLKRRLYIRRPT
jgi:hypothetical protein